MSLPLLSLLSLLAGVRAAKDGVCLLYADDNTRSFYFSGVTAGGALHPQLLNFASWDSLLLGLAAGEDENTLYVVPTGVGSDQNMTIATLATTPNGTARVSYATLGDVPGYDIPGAFTYMPTMHLDAARGQMVALLQGLQSRPPAATRVTVGDPGDLFLVVADVIPANGTVARVLLDLSEQDMRWGSGVISGVSAFNDATYYVNPIGSEVPSGQAIYGFPLNGSEPVVAPYGAATNVAHLFYSAAQSGLLVITTDGHGAPTLARFSPPSPTFTPIFSWNTSGGLQDWGLYDVTPDGTKLLSVLVDAKGLAPRLVVLDLVNLKELSRVSLQGFSSADTVCDIAWCNV
jgi:hypothetical protein